MRLSLLLLPPFALLSACSSSAPDPTLKTTSFADTADDAGAVVGAGDDGGDASALSALPQGLRYDQVQQTSFDASCVSGNVLFDKLVLDRVRSVSVGPPGTIAVPGTRCGAGTRTDSLAVLAAFHAAVPDHEVVTVWIEDDGTLSSDDFDARIASALGRDAIFTPADFLARCNGATALHDAAKTCGWPTLDELVGKIMVVRTGPRFLLDAYASSDAQANARLAFVAPNLVSSFSRARTLASIPSYVVLSNVDGPLLSEKPLLDSAPEIVVRNDAYDDQAAWLAMKSEGLHQIGASQVDATALPSVTTVVPGGSVFTCRGNVIGCQGRIEPRDAIAMGATTGNIGGTADSFVFEYETSSSPATTWRAYVAGSAAESRAKGCLMARASLDPAAAYFAVCNLPETGTVRVQFRKTLGGASSTIELPTPSAPTYLQLATADALGSNCFAGALSGGGASSTPIGPPTCFAASLPLQGIATSSNGGSEAKFVFGNVTRTVGAPSAVAVAPAKGVPTIAASVVAQVTPITGFSATSAIGASAAASTGTCTLPLDACTSAGCTAWQTIDAATLSFDAPGTSTASWSQIALDDRSNLIQAGALLSTNGYEWVTRQSTAQGSTWSAPTVFQNSPGADTVGNAIASSPGQDGGVTFASTGFIGSSWPQAKGLLRMSTDRGATWNATPLTYQGKDAFCTPTFATSGLLYLGCWDNGPSLHSDILVETLAPGATTPQPIDVFSWDYSWGTDLSDIFVDSKSTVWVVGRTSGDASGGSNNALLIRQKPTNKPFAPVLTWPQYPTQDGESGAMAEDTLNHILYVTSSFTDVTGASYGVVLSSTQGGVRGTWNELTGARFQLVDGFDTFFGYILVDRNQNVHVPSLPTCVRQFAGQSLG